MSHRTIIARPLQLGLAITFVARRKPSFLTRIMSSYKHRHLALSFGFALLMPLSVLTAQFAGATLPFIPAAIIAGLACGGCGALLILSICRFLGF